MRDPSARLDLVIVGGGATGVELAVELVEASHVVSAYGLRAERDLAITLVEGAPRIPSALPEKISQAATARLTELGIRVETSCRVAGSGRRCRADRRRPPVPRAAVHVGGRHPGPRPCWPTWACR